MRADKMVVAGLLAAAFIISVPDMAVCQSRATSADHSTRGKASVMPGDPELLTFEMLTPDVDSRLFVDSFLVSLFTMDPGEVYDAYLHPDMTAALSREAFQQQVAELKDVVGPLTRVDLTYLRQEDKGHDGMDGGWTEHVLVFERDPRVQARVEFKRVGDGRWRVTHSGIRSAQLDRLQEARAAAGQAAEGTADGGEEGGDNEPPTPDSRP